MKAKLQTIKVHTSLPGKPPEMMERDAYVSGGLAYHPYRLVVACAAATEWDFWCVTHIASGLALPHLDLETKDEARRAVAVLLASGVDWTLDAAGLRAALPKATREPLWKDAQEAAGKAVRR